jgi:hypothetical protein
MYVHGGVYADADASQIKLNGLVEAHDKALLSQEPSPILHDGEHELIPLLFNESASAWYTRFMNNASAVSRLGMKTWENNNLGIGPRNIVQWFMVYAPNHILMERMLTTMCENIHGWDDTKANRQVSWHHRVLWMTGPNAFSIVFVELAPKNILKSGDVRFIPNDFHKY